LHGLRVRVARDAWTPYITPKWVASPPFLPGTPRLVWQPSRLLRVEAGLTRILRLL